MKKNLKFVALLVLSVLFVACGSKSSLVATSQGVGDLKLGVKYPEIPESVEGLYTKKVVELIDPDMSFEGEEAFIQFYDGEELVMDHTSYNMDGTFDHLTIYSPKVETSMGVKVGDKAEVLVGKEFTIDRLGGYYFEDYYIQISGEPIEESSFTKYSGEGPHTFAEELIPEASVIASISIRKK